MAYPPRARSPRNSKPCLGPLGAPMFSASCTEQHMECRPAPKGRPSACARPFARISVPSKPPHGVGTRAVGQKRARHPSPVSAQLRIRMEG